MASTDPGAAGAALGSPRVGGSRLGRRRVGGTSLSPLGIGAALPAGAPTTWPGRTGMIGGLAPEGQPKGRNGLPSVHPAQPRQPGNMPTGFGRKQSRPFRVVDRSSGTVDPRRLTIGSPCPGPLSDCRTRTRCCVVSWATARVGVPRPDSGRQHAPSKMSASERPAASLTPLSNGRRMWPKWLNSSV